MGNAAVNIKPPPFVPSIERTAIEKHLRTVAKGDLVSYETISALIGRDVRSGARHIMEGARKTLLREGVGFLVHRNIGLQRMTDADLARIPGERGRKRIRRVCGKEVRYTISADYHKLSDADKIKHNAALSFLGALKLATTPKKLQRIEAAVAIANGKIPLDRTLEVFRKK